MVPGGLAGICWDKVSNKVRGDEEASAGCRDRWASVGGGRAELDRRGWDIF